MHLHYIYTGQRRVLVRDAYVQRREADCASEFFAMDDMAGHRVRMAEQFFSAGKIAVQQGFAHRG
ncbi:hypothetical protein D3C76_1788820 [compost metagenome]